MTPPLTGLRNKRPRPPVELRTICARCARYGRLSCRRESTPRCLCVNFSQEIER